MRTIRLIPSRILHAILLALTGLVPAIEAKGGGGHASGGHSSGGHSSSSGKSSSSGSKGSSSGVHLSKYPGSVIYVNSGGHDVCYNYSDTQHLHPIKCPVTNAAIIGIVIGSIALFFALFFFSICFCARWRSRKQSKSLKAAIAAQDIEGILQPRSTPIRKPTRPDNAKEYKRLDSPDRSPELNPVPLYEEPITEKDSENTFHENFSGGFHPGLYTKQ